MPDIDTPFDRWALTYDDDMEKANDSDDWMFGGYYRILDKVIEYCELEKYENPLVLDIGAGTGNLSAKFLEKELMVTATDP
jgi:putative AdoMet-dependent methyltransferase